jgi:hypothetical protein
MLTGPRGGGGGGGRGEEEEEEEEAEYKGCCSLFMSSVINSDIELSMHKV